MNFGDFKSLTIEVPSCRITVEAGEKFGLDYELSAAYEVTEVCIREGTLHFHCKHRYPVALFHWNTSSNYVRVTVPREVWLERADINNISGPVEITGIRAAALCVKAVSGRIVASGLTVKEGMLESISGGLTIENSVFDRLTQRGKSGGFHGLALTTSALDSELASGSIRLNGKFSGETRLRTISGSIEVNSELPLAEYRYFMKTVSGSKKVNGQSGERLENPSALHTITVQATSGSIRLNFAR